MADTGINALVTLLITEIRLTLNARIDILNEKIELQCEETKRLRMENEKLKEIITTKDNKITQLQQASETLPVQSVKSPVFHPVQAMPSAPQRPRGIKVHNLIFTCPDIAEKDPKEYIENLLQEKYFRKINVNNVQLLNKRGQQQSQSEDITTRGNSYNDATFMQNCCRILVTFNSVWELRCIYRERIQALRNSGIFISEDLYKEESHLFYMARMLKRKNTVVSAWTEEGQVYIVEKQGQIPRILTRNDPILNNFEEIKKEETQKEITPYHDREKENSRKIENEPETNGKQATEDQEKIPEDTASDSCLISSWCTQKEKKKAAIKKRRNPQ